MMVQSSKRVPRSPKEAKACCGPLDDLLDPVLFKALCDPTRVRLLGCLIKCGRACSVGEVAECCDVDFSVVSRHLQLLHRSGVVTMRKEGRTVSYEVAYQAISRTLRELAGAIESHSPRACCGGDSQAWGTACDYEARAGATPAGNDHSSRGSARGAHAMTRNASTLARTGGGKRRSVDRI